MELRHRGNRSDHHHQMETFQVLESPDSRKDEPDEATNNQKCLSAVPTLIVTLTAFVILNLFVYYMDNRLPDTVEANLTSGDFVAKRAMTTLVKLSNLGPRPVGSYENEKLAFELFKTEVQDVINDSDNANSVQMLNQKVSGSFLLNMKGWKYLLSYEDLQNVVVRVDPKRPGSANDAVLLNCHYDSVPAGPGVSDNGVNCAVMVELLRILAKKTDLKRSIVFLFNGGEEIILQASHGFVTQHPWSRVAKYVINLDSCGAGGREILFQTTKSDSYLVDLYARAVPHPYGQAIGEELFQSGAIPSDTDFRIFRDFGNMSGLDLAHYKNGYVYHTAYDDLDRVEPAVLQNTGENLLALVEALSAHNASRSRSTKSTKYVFFDVFGVYMFSYTELSGTVANLVIVMVSFFSIFLSLRAVSVGMNRRQYSTHLLSAIVLSPVCSAVLAGLSCGLVAFCLDRLDRSMSWYSNRANLAVYCATASLAVTAAAVFHPKTKSRTNAEWAVSLLNGVQFYWTVLLLVITMAGLRSAYFFAAVVLFPAVASCVLGVLHNPNVRSVGPRWAAVYATSLVAPAAFVCYLTQMFTSLLVPLTGRIGPGFNPDYAVAALMAASTYATVGHVAPIAVLVRNPQMLLTGLAIWVSLSTAIVVVTPLGFPYSTDHGDLTAAVRSPRVERFDLVHTRRTFYDLGGVVRRNDSGYSVINWDRHSPRTVARESVPEMGAAVPADCAGELLCGVPFTGGLASRSSWIPLGRPPALPTSARTEVKVVDVQNGLRRRLEFGVIGPERLTVYVSPYSGTKLKSWSFPDGPEVSTRWAGHDVYVVRHSRGGSGSDNDRIATWNFWLEQESNHGFDGPSVNVTVTYNWVVRKRLTLDDEFQSFVDSFPRWAHVNYALASIEAFVL